MTKSLFEKVLGNVKLYWEKSGINIFTVIVYEYWIFDIPIIGMSRIEKKEKKWKEEDKKKGIGINGMKRWKRPTRSVPSLSTQRA